jgi:hypothetical protein
MPSNKFREALDTRADSAAGPISLSTSPPNLIRTLPVAPPTPHARIVRLMLPEQTIARTVPSTQASGNSRALLICVGLVIHAKLAVAHRAMDELQSATIRLSTCDKSGSPKPLGPSKAGRPGGELDEHETGPPQKESDRAPPSAEVTQAFPLEGIARRQAS